MSAPRDGSPETSASGPSDPWTPDALERQDRPTIAGSFGEMKEGMSKLADGTAGLVIALIVILLAFFANREDDENGNKATSNPWIDLEDPIWAAEPIPNDAWEMDASDVSRHVDDYLYGSDDDVNE